MKKQITSALIATTLLGTGASSIAHATNDNQQGEIKEPIFIKGGNLDSDQTEETKKDLGVSDRIKTIDINTQEVSEFTHHDYNTIYSSAYIEPKSFTSGVDVEIVTKDTITDVSEAQYMNAAISAGIQNAKIKIASVNTVTGEGALTGIYKAYQDENNSLDQNDIDNAANEMNTLSSISKNHKDDPNYSDGKLNNAVADMKGQVAKEKEDNKDVSNDDTNKIMNDTLADKKLDNILNNNEKENINNILIQTANSKVVNNDPKTFIKQTNHLTDKISEAVDKGKDKLNNDQNQSNDKSLWSKFKSFIKGLFN